MNKISAEADETAGRPLPETLAEAIARANAAEAEIAWRDGTPEKNGYYLAAWNGGVMVGVGRYLVVSELWFNPDARPSWWLSRGYAGQSGRGVTDAVTDVVAWMPMPNPPKETA